MQGTLEDALKEMGKSLTRSATSRKRARRQANLSRHRFDWDAPHREDSGSEEERRRNGWPTLDELPRLRERGGNPYLEFWLRYGDWDWESASAVDSVGWSARWSARQFATGFFAWAVPGPEAIESIARLDRPVLDLGAGRGYWAWQLCQAGVETAAFEPWIYRAKWAETVSRKPDKWRSRYALLFCWPSYNERWAGRLLSEHKGDTVIYVGEGDGGCTGDDKFHRMLERRYRQEGESAIPQWYGIHDRLTIWRR